MLFLLAGGESLVGGISVIFVALALFVFVICIASAKRNADNATKNSNVERQNPPESGLSPHQREYIESLRKKNTEQKNEKSKPDPESTHTHHGNAVVANSDGHVHMGSVEERYDAIGSLGEVHDEGCADLNGVRLIANDIAYSASEQRRDYSDVAKAMVLGEILDEPRFKKRYGKK